jgi:hypothetical protein
MIQEETIVVLSKEAGLPIVARWMICTGNPAA